MISGAIAGYIVIGLIAGIFAGFFGVGGGVIMVPALVWFFKLSQHQAQGLSLAALVLPVGILGVWAYHRVHPFPLKPAAFIALGMFFGAYFGATVAQIVPERPLRILFGSLIILFGLKLIFGR